MAYRVRGSYFESCNCEAICPCRMVGGAKGGRSTYGICFGVLSWAIEEGRVNDVDVSVSTIQFLTKAIPLLSRTKNPEDPQGRN